jgi:hypothetical protein
MFNFYTNLNIYFIQLINKLLLVLLYIVLLYIALILGYLRLYESFGRILPTSTHSVKNGWYVLTHWSLAFSVSYVFLAPSHLYAQDDLGAYSGWQPLPPPYGH